ncbi:MAG: NADH:flavin oxidoreductase [Hyphomicrobiales bacterium]|nr:NADH:flavin oxidoreductase [Hyphomicrobiales bacterium]
MTATVLSPLTMRNLAVKNRVFRSNISGRFDNEDGSLTQTRINWERMFAQGGAGAIISSYVPVLMSGRIIAGYATIHHDGLIPAWATLVKAVHAHGCKFIMQLSHGGRQIDVPGLHNQFQAGLSATDRSEGLHGFPAKAMTPGEIDHMIAAFAQGAWRAREAGVDGVELHAANGYLFTQFLSSAINDRDDRYGGGVFNRARFLLDVIQAIRLKVGPGYHLQVKISAVDHNNVLPWEGRGNTLAEMIEVAKMAQNAGADALHVSSGSLFPHPLNPPGDFSFNTIAATYDAMLASGTRTLRNYALFRFAMLRPIFRWLWFRMKAGRPVEGVSADEAYAIKQAVTIPVISTGGWQSRSVIDRHIADGYFDAVSIARSLIANPDLPQQWAAGRDAPPKPCTYCNKCLLNAPKNPLGCYDETRFGGDRAAMIASIMRIYDVKPELTAHQPNEWRGAA